ncbi:MAG: hypothetical protein WC415_00115 [Patescibacteria group bacterium]|jgi:hypothetical protein
MFSTSQDILFLVIATCVAAFTIFSCWGLFYFVGILRNSFKVSRDARRIIEKAEGILDALKEKINSSASYLFLIGEALKKIVEVTKDFRDKKNSKKKDKESEE